MKRILNIFIVLIIGAAAVCSCGRKIIPSVPGISKEYDSIKFDYLFVEALKLKVLGNGGEALKYFEECLRINPGSGAAYFQMAQIVLAAGDVNNGKKYLKEAIRIEPGNKWYLMMIAGTYYQEGKLDSSIIYYERAAANYRDKEDMMLTLATLYSASGKFDEAGQIYEHFDSKYGVNQRSTAEAIKNLMWAEKYSEAENKALELLREYPDEILYNGLLAEIYSARGEPEKAMEVYRGLMERNPGNPQTLLSLCDFLLAETKYDDLFELLNIVTLNEDISREDKLSLFARILETDDIVKKESEKLTFALMILEAQYREDHIVQLYRPELLSIQGKYEEASARLDEIIKYQPDNYFAWEKLLLVSLDNEDFKRLEEKGKECATRFNRSFLAKVLYATGASQNGNFETALEELRKAEILAGNNPEMRMQMLSIKADVLYKMKNYAETWKTFDEALAVNEDDIATLNNYAYYLAEQNIRLKEAEIMAEKAINKERNNYTYLDTYGWVLYKRGKLKEAERIFREIIENSSEEDAEYFEHYGYVLKGRKKCRDAVNNWISAIRADSNKIYLEKEIIKCEGRR